MPKQFGAGKCSLCGSPGTSKATCPLNPKAKNPNPKKHPLAKKSQVKPEVTQVKPKVTQVKPEVTQVKPKVTQVKPEQSKFLQLKGPGSMPKPSKKSTMLTKKIRPNLSKKTFLQGLSILDNRNRVRNPEEYSRRRLGLDTMDALFSLPKDVGNTIFEYSTEDKRGYTKYELEHCLGPDEEKYIPSKKIILPVNYINNGIIPSIKGETGQYAYFIVAPYKFTLLSEDYVTWFNSYSTAINNMQNYDRLNFCEEYNSDFGMPELYIYFFDSNNFYLVATTDKKNGRYEINVNLDVLKNINGDNYEGTSIHGAYDEDLDKEFVYIQQPTNIDSFKINML